MWIKISVVNREVLWSVSLLPVPRGQAAYRTHVQFRKVLYFPSSWRRCTKSIVTSNSLNNKHVICNPWWDSFTLFCVTLCTVIVASHAANSCLIMRYRSTHTKKKTNKQINSSTRNHTNNRFCRNSTQALLLWDNAVRVWRVWTGPDNLSHRDFNTACKNTCSCNIVKSEHNQDCTENVEQCSLTNAR